MPIGSPVAGSPTCFRIEVAVISFSSGGAVRLPYECSERIARVDTPKVKATWHQNEIKAYITGQTDECPREHFFFYVSDDGDLTALRYDNWKFVFKEQRCPGTLQVWAEPFTDLRIPKIFNLRTDPYERADITSNTYYDWLLDHAFMAIPAQAYVATMLQTFAEFPPRQKSASFNLDQVITKLQETAKSD